MRSLKDKTTLYNISIIKFNNFKLRNDLRKMVLIKNAFEVLENREEQWLDSCLDKL